jgi:DNA-binding NtrC family response regulator
MASAASYKILYGESNEQVMAAHAASLEQAGHSVEKVLGRKAVEDALRQHSFDLVVLGPTLTRNDRHHLPYMAKKAQQAIRVLVLHSDGAGHPQVDIFLETGRNSIQDALAAIGSAAPMAKTAAAGTRR